MRESRSPIGSFNAMRPSSPARLHETGNHAFGAEFPERDAAHLQLAVIGARPSRHFAAVAHAVLGGIARKLGELQRRRETLFHRRVLVAGDGAQLPAPRRIPLNKPRPPLVLLDRTGLRHQPLLSPSAFERGLNACSLPERKIE